MSCFSGPANRSGEGNWRQLSIEGGSAHHQAKCSDGGRKNGNVFQYIKVGRCSGRGVSSCWMPDSWEVLILGLECYLQNVLSRLK
jgi:hypothetical protein